MNDVPTSNKSRTVALVLHLVGGLLGCHYFYVGRFWRGIVCAFTLNFWFIGYFVDLYRITRYMFKDDEGNVLRV